jgi:hypothetical protein
MMGLKETSLTLSLQMLLILLLMIPARQIFAKSIHG